MEALNSKQTQLSNDPAANQCQIRVGKSHGWKHLKALLEENKGNSSLHGVFTLHTSRTECDVPKVLRCANQSPLQHFELGRRKSHLKNAT